MLVPLYGFLKGDTVGLLVLVQDSDPVREIGRSLQEAASMRIAPRPDADVYYLGARLDPALTVREAGLDVVPKEA
jgi:hypothetical protein